MASDENAEQPPIVDEGNNSPTNHQVGQQGTTDAGNPNATSVSVLSPQKQQYLPDNHEDKLGALGKRPSSNSSSRESRRRLELEIEIAADEASAEIERKQQEFELRLKQREMELELATQKEAMELAEMKRQKDLSVKMKKMEIMDQVSSRGSVSSASGSFRFRQGKTKSWVNSQENKFDSHLEETLDDKPSFPKLHEPPCSSKQADAKMKSLTTPKPSTLSMDGKPKKSLQFNANVFVPSAACAGTVKAASSTPGPPSTLPLGSTLAMLPPVSVSMKLPKLVLDKFDGNPLEWPEWSEQFLATVDGSGASDSHKMQYLKTLVTGKAKAAIDGMGYSGQMYHVAWQTLEHDFGRPELVVNAQLRKIHAYSFIKPYDSSEIVKYSQVVSGCVNVLTQFGYEMDISSESVLNSAVRNLPNDLKNKWLTYLQRYDVSHKNMRVFSAWLKSIAQVQENMRLQFGSTSDKATANFTKNRTKSTSFAATSDSSSPTKTQCPLKDGEHKI